MSDDVRPPATTDEPGFQPYVADDNPMQEFTWRAVTIGTLLGLVFAASSLYLVLKVGMTVSATIPVAVVAVTVFRTCFRTTILENNIIQTAGSAGESIAFGVGVTMPALLMLGFQMDLIRVMTVAILGGSLGILAMIPLRRAFISGAVQGPNALRYPEGVAAAEVLISGEKGGSTGATVFVGFAVAFAHKLLTEGFHLLKLTLGAPLTFINRAAEFAGDAASELLGVGYIIGLRTSAIMMGGAVLGYLVIIPMIYYIGESATLPIAPSPEKTIGQMDVGDIRHFYLLYIGAGCVAAAGIISMGRTLPVILRSITGGMSTATSGAHAAAQRVVRRTERDMPLGVVFLGSALLLVVLALFLMTEVGPTSAVLGALLVLLFGFLFVTVSARLTGLIGSSSNPISGMTVATLLLTCLIFLGLGYTTPSDRLLALSVAAVVCIAASNGGTTAQSLKTGHIVGGTPRAMQYAILIGSFASAVVIGGTLLAFNRAGTVYSGDSQYMPSDAEKHTVALTSEERSRLMETETYKDTKYLVWDTRRDAFSAAKHDRKQVLKAPEGTAPEGRFLVDPTTGTVAFLVDPTIGGKIHSVEGHDTTRFDAPKTQVMKIIIDGVLGRKLNWALVLIGAMIAVTLELCGISSLAFAVGIYVPIENSTPIFLGGIVRWIVDSVMERNIQSESKALIASAVADAENRRTSREDAEREARAQAEIMAFRKRETSPGMLLASGLIAGGSLAGILIAFMEFVPDWKNGIDFSARLKGFAYADATALGCFLLLAGFLLLVGLGKVFPAAGNGEQET